MFVYDKDFGLCGLFSKKFRRCMVVNCYLFQLFQFFLIKIIGVKGEIIEYYN